MNLISRTRIVKPGPKTVSGLCLDKKYQWEDPIKQSTKLSSELDSTHIAADFQLNVLPVEIKHWMVL
jgi:hypothetical protein